jgi:hypothetical protein
MMLFNPDAAASCDAEFRMMGDLPPWLLALTGYGKVAAQQDIACPRLRDLAARLREVWLVNLLPS